jgi:DNA repair exonuclease SbcCD ATPase subunit
MSITPLALRLEKFGSFSVAQNFVFPTMPGLYLMLGKNEVEPRLTGNGTGKTTIWNGLTWLLHGKTASGLKAGDVCSWGHAKGTRVVFDFIHDDVVCYCARTWGPNTWTLQVEGGDTYDLAKDPQNPLLAELRLHFDAWLATILMAQGEAYFLDMEKGKQASLFGSVMDLEEWERRAERASKAASAQMQVVNGLDVDLSRAEGKLEMVDVLHVRDRLEAWEDGRKAQLEGLDEEHKKLTARRKGLKHVLDHAVDDEQVERDRLARLGDDKALQDEYDLVRADVRRHEDKLLKLKVEVDALLSHVKQLDKSEGKCPVCGSTLDTKHWQDEMKRAERMAQGMKAEADNINAALNVAKSRRDVLEVDIDKRADVERALDRAISTTSQARNALLACDKELDRTEEAYEKVEKEVNPFIEYLERAKEYERTLHDEVDDLRARIADAEGVHYIKQMWVTGFKEIRLREIASALSELEVEVNSAVVALGLNDWSLEFAVDRELKGGTVQRGFNVTVRAPDAKDKPVPWEAWSGGEKQRLRIAGNAGLSDLVRARTGCGLQLEVWDEPTNGLSPEGKTDLFEYLAERARNEARIIILLDHQAHDFGGFAGTCTIIKTPSGSRIRHSW